jgi:hypothetical protein
MLDLVIGARRKDLGGFEVGCVLPFMRRRMVGPSWSPPVRERELRP